MSTPIIRRRKRAVEVDTIQWTGDNEADVAAFAGGPQFFYALDDADRENCDDPEATAAVYDRLHSTWVLVYTGQHIVRGIKGEFYPIAEDVLAETYDLPTAADPVTEARREDAELLFAESRAHAGRAIYSAGIKHAARLIAERAEETAR